MFENSIHLSNFEKEIIEEALSWGQKASIFDQNNNEIEALIYYNKAITVIDREIKKLSHEKQNLLQTIHETYKERIKIIETFKKRKDFQFLDDSMLVNRSIDFNLILSNIMKGKKNPTKEKNNIIEDVNFFINFKQNEGKQETLEDSLNIIDLRQKVLFLLKIIEKTISTGGYLTKNLYVPTFIWKIQIEGIEKKIIHIKKINEELKNFINNDSGLYSKNINLFKNVLINLYKEDKFQNLLNEYNGLKKKSFDVYEDLIKKNLTKLNLYMKSNNLNQNDFNELIFNLIKNMKTIIEDQKFIDKSDENLEKNKKFLLIFFKDAVIKILISELELKFNQFLLMIQKKNNTIFN